MPYYRVCPRCGACLDPGESCDCGAREGEAKRQGRQAGGPEAEWARMAPWKIGERVREEDGRA